MASDFADRTRAYHRWLGRYLVLDPEGLAEKREKMDKKRKRFPFLRGTFYLWHRQFGAVDRVVRHAPAVLSAGDAHLENFGTWRDAEGRLAWGLNDFDEAAELPFTSDLVRLSASLLLARDAEEGVIALDAAAGVAALLSGYRTGLEAGSPFVLEREELEPIRRAALAGRTPAQIWEKFAREGTEGDPPDRTLLHLLLTALPQGAREPVFRRVPRKGLGSLGRPRWVVLARWRGGLVAREAKATAPSAQHMDVAVPPSERIRDQRRLVAEARRVPDPGFLLTEDWVLRRLSPEMHKIELAAMLPEPTAQSGVSVRDPRGEGGSDACGEGAMAAPPASAAPAQRALLEAMGAEIANLHLGTAGDPAALHDWLAARDGDGAWLLAAAEAALERLAADHQAFRADPGVVEAIPVP